MSSQVRRAAAKHYKVDRADVRKRTQRDKAQELEEAKGLGFYTYTELDVVPLSRVKPERVWKPSRIEAIRKALAVGKALPPIQVIESGGKYEIEDGIHRYNAAKEWGFTHIPVYVKKVVQTPELLEQAEAEKPVLKPGTWVKWRKDPGHKYPWGYVVDYLGPRKWKGVTRHMYEMLAGSSNDVDFVGDFRDDSFDPVRESAVPKNIRDAILADPFAHTASRTADLMPPLGFPGGPCHVVKRIDDKVRNPKREDKLITLVESGVSLSNNEAANVYRVESERGVWKFKQLKLTIHAQYRMDLRGVTVPEIRMAIGSFFRTYNTAKSRPKDQDQARAWEMKMMRREEIRWTDPKIKLTVVFTADAARGQLTLISTWWEGQKDPSSPGNCRVAAVWCRKSL